jgi:microcin C transport system ATP-binding protein
LLDIQALRIAFDGHEVVHGVSLSLAPGERLALVGESGSGKSVTALSILRLLESAQISGQVRWQGRDLLELPERELQAIRGDEIAMIFQEPMTALNPLMTIGEQIAEVLQLKKGLERKQAWQRVLTLLEETGIDAPARRADSYPHQLSGGQRQRAMVAMALASEPKLLLADEPTTALDASLRCCSLPMTWPWCGTSRKGWPSWKRDIWWSRATATPCLQRPIILTPASCWAAAPIARDWRQHPMAAPRCWPRPAPCR